MALSAASMKNDVLNALKSGADTPEKANKKFGDAVLKHICDNITITYGWTAVLPPPSSSPDPCCLYRVGVGRWNAHAVYELPAYDDKTGGAY
jgi:hypothetical protein